jgi:hypothetical protein
VWDKLRGVPGIITPNSLGKEEKDLVGIAFSPQSGTNDAEFQCGPAPVIVRGGVIVAALEDGKSNVNKMTNKFELAFIGAKGGKQVPERFAGGPKETFELSGAGGAFEEVGLTMTVIQETTPKTIKVELRHCEKNVC